VPRIAQPSAVLVLVPPHNRVRSTAWVTVRRTFRPVNLETWIGPRRADVARATADYALSLVRISDVRTVVARVVRDQYCTVDELRTQLESGPRRGSALLRQALDEVSVGAASAPEAEAARVLRRAGLTGFEQNVPILLPDGTTFVADFLWPHVRAILEIDSREFHLDPADWEHTLQRHLRLTTHGYSVVHRPPSALRDERGFAREIAAWLRGREADLRRGVG
jgi:very-short-patch-repair endonuclease